MCQEALLQMPEKNYINNKILPCDWIRKLVLRTNIISTRLTEINIFLVVRAGADGMDIPLTRKGSSIEELWGGVIL